MKVVITNLVETFSFLGLFEFSIKLDPCGRTRTIYSAVFCFAKKEYKLKPWY
jgi:hypothetical protein